MAGERLMSEDKLAFTLTLWVIYDHPLDFPNVYVARKHVVRNGCTHPTKEYFQGVTLASVRGAVVELNPGLVRRPRDESDDPVIVETWL